MFYKFFCSDFHFCITKIQIHLVFDRSLYVSDTYHPNQLFYIQKVYYVSYCNPHRDRVMTCNR